MTQIATTGVKGLSNFLNSDQIKAKFTEILGEKGNGFIASVLSVVSSNNKLADVDQNSIYLAALMAASLDLPINANLGHAYIIPYGKKAQFQVSAKGFKQLAIRSGQFKYISDAIVYEGQLVSENPLTGFEFDWTTKTSEKVIGYVSYFKLLNGFESTFYMTSKEAEAHGKKYSKSFNRSDSLWKTDRDKMALKTVTKLNLSKNAPLSIQMQKATISDQAVIKDMDGDTVDVDYVDAEPKQSIDPDKISEDKEYKRITDHINKAKTVKSLEQVKELLKDEIHETLFAEKYLEITRK